VLFDNGAVRPPGKTRYQIKLSWTAAPPALINSQDRTKGMRVRYIPLSTREQARDNWHRKRKQQGRYAFQPEEQATCTNLLLLAREHDRARKDDQPLALLGCVSHRFGIEGTIRHPQFGLVLWRPVDDGWLPSLNIIQSFTGVILEPRDRQTGERQPAIYMQPGRGKGVMAHGTYHSDALLKYMQVPYMDTVVAANLRQMAANTAAINAAETPA